MSLSTHQLSCYSTFLPTHPWFGWAPSLWLYFHSQLFNNSISFLSHTWLFPHVSLFPSSILSSQIIVCVQFGWTRKLIYPAFFFFYQWILALLNWSNGRLVIWLKAKFFLAKEKGASCFDSIPWTLQIKSDMLIRRLGKAVEKGGSLTPLYVKHT